MLDDEIAWLLVALLLLGGGAAKVAAQAPPATSSGRQVNPGDQLIPGASYRAAIKLTGIEAAFGTSDAVKAKLEEAGFSDVQVTDHGGGAFDATGKWNGGAVAAKMPAQVVSVVQL